MKTLLTLLLALAMGATFEFDKTVHDFGEISLKDGPLSCTFTVTNTGDEPLTIFAVVSTCGCTGATWTRESIAPGDSGEVSVTYTNDEGPYPFDKSLTVYTSAQKKPIVLHLRGTVVKESGRRK